MSENDRISVSSIFVALAILLTATMATRAQAAILSYNIFKYQNYAQTSNSPPVMPVSFTGLADINDSVATDVTSASIASSSPLSPMLLTGVAGGKAVVFSAGLLSSKAILDTDFPNNANYGFAITGGTLAGQSASLQTPASDAYSATIPFFTDSIYTMLQNFNPANVINLTFNSWGALPGVNSEFTAVNIQQLQPNGATVYSTSGSDALTSALVPANTLLPGMQYDLSLIYAAGIATPNAGFGTATATTYYDLRTDLIFTTSAATTATPEPSSTGLAALGAAILVLGIRKRGLKNETFTPKGS